MYRQLTIAIPIGHIRTVRARAERLAVVMRE
jgi:hypothetical protein